MSRTVVDGLVEDYLRRLDAAAAGLSPDRRTDLLEGIGEHIDAARAAGAAGDEAAVRSLLDRLGTPEEIVGEAYREPGPGWPTPVSRRGYALEGWAVGMLTGGSLLPFVGWFIGVVLLWTSGLWSRRDKLLGTFVLPFGPCGLFYYRSLYADPQECAAPARCLGGALTPSAAEWVLLALWGAVPLVMGVVLLRRARRRALAGPAVPVRTPGTWGGLEIAGLVVLAAGSFVLPVGSSVIGLALAACSRRWRAWEIGLASLIVAVPFAVLVAFYVTEGSFGPGNGTLVLAALGSLVFPALAALFLGLRLRARS